MTPKGLLDKTFIALERNLTANMDIVGHAVSMINADQCRIKFLALTPMSINKYQCRSMKIIIEPHFGSITEL